MIKSRAYFEEKILCQEQLNTQKNRIDFLKKDIAKVKFTYAQSLKNLEQISNEIHMKRNHLNLTEENDILRRPREPGVGAELSNDDLSRKHGHCSLPDYKLELEKCETYSVDSCSAPTSSAVSERDEMETLDDLHELKLRVKELAIRPVDGGEGRSTDDVWENELRNTVEKLDHMMLMKECADDLNSYANEVRLKCTRSVPNTSGVQSSDAGDFMPGGVLPY